jgi:CO/xanthine dehydrogenase FAD-binding subunit
LGLAQYFRPEVVEDALDLLEHVPLTVLAGGTETCP